MNLHRIGISIIRCRISLTGEFLDGAVRIYSAVKHLDALNDTIMTENTKIYRVYKINDVEESLEIVTHIKIGLPYTYSNATRIIKMGA